MNDSKIKVLLVEPEKYPKEIVIDDSEEPQAVLERFIGKVLATAGGERLKHEETGFKEIAIFKTGVTL